MKGHFETFFHLTFLVIFTVLLSALFATHLIFPIAFILTSLFSLFYFLWGVFYHAGRGDLKIEIVLEYGSIAALVFLIAFFFFIIR